MSGPTGQSSYSTSSQKPYSGYCRTVMASVG